MKAAFLCFSFFCLSSLALAQSAEVRGVWIARDSLTSRAEIRATMQQMAEANLNLALVDVWTRGYPLWNSRVFERETGLQFDPGFVGRDVLAETIEEARAFGITVMPWFEYGFVGGYTGYFPGPGGRGPIFERHPDWLAKTKDGETRFTAPGGYFYWMAQTRPDVQEFVIQLMEEVLRNYEVAGVQYDRARYPQLDCGYDDFTIELFKRENNGAAPPDAGNNAQWMRWRADKINDFVVRMHQRLKAVGRQFLVSNAPVVYPFSYVNFAQDYPAWMRAGALDFTNVQIYRATAADYEAELNRQLNVIPARDRFVPGIDVTNGGADELVRMIELTRAKGLPGVVIWYFKGLQQANALTRLKQTVYAQPARLPWVLQPNQIRPQRVPRQLDGQKQARRKRP